MGGSMHIADFSVGMLGANAIVGAGIPIAVGAAWSCRYRKTNQIAVSFFGDGAVNEGAFHEALNLAAVWKLPVVFVCENNMYGFSTHYRRVTPVESIAEKAAAYGMQGVTVDGMDLNAVYREAEKAVLRARAGKGPTLMECKTYRYMGHSRFEKAAYRTIEELEEWKKRDPIMLFKKRLGGRLGVNKEKVDAVNREAEKTIEEAVRFAENSPEPNPDDYKNYIFA